MTSTRADKLTTIALSVFSLNGLLTAWGDGFCRPYGLTSSRWQVLGAIALASTAPSVPQVAAAMGLTRQGVQKQIDLLLAEGLVQPQPNPAHKRSPLYTLTPQGEKTYQTLAQHWQQHVQTLCGNFSKADLDATLRVLCTLSRVHAVPPQSD